jgi:predicted amidohydrolase
MNPTPETAAAPAYLALALQTRCDSVAGIADPAAARAAIAAAIRRIGAEIAAGKAFLGADCRLVVLPEYFLTGFPMGDGSEAEACAWTARACLAMDGPEYEALGRIAQERAVFLSGNAYETDPKFPGLFFQTAFVIAPSGAVVLRYRRLNSMFAPTPHDVWEDYLDAYGLEGVFPVARTEIGNLAAIASEEILYPEIARCHAMRGAEVFLHGTSQANETARHAKGVATVARAIENLAYVVSANSAGITGTALPAESADGGSAVIDYRGIVLARSGPGATLSAAAEIDLAALRRYRRRPGMENLLSRQRLELFAASYAGTHFYPANTLKGQAPSRGRFVRNQIETIERLSRLGII